MLKLKLSRKMIGGFMVMGVLLLIGGLIGSLGISQVSGDLKSFSEHHLPAIHYLATIGKNQQMIGMIDQSLLVLDSQGTDSERTRLFAQSEEAWYRAEEARKRYAALPKEGSIATKWNGLKPLWNTWRQQHDTFMQLVREEKPKKAASLLSGPLGNSFARSKAYLHELSDFSMHLSEEARKNGLAQASRQKMTAVAWTVIGIIAALAFGIFFARSITVPVNRVIRNLTETSDQFAEAAHQISLSSNRLAEGTSIQAQEVENASRMIEELKPIIQKGTDDIENLNKMSRNALGLGMRVFDMLKQAKNAMKEIKTSSEESVGIVKAIEKIAFQTNLLALSASVEAASAGEAGAGFSVVSEDVRNLGARSTDAVKHTIGLIDKTIKVVNGGNQFVGTSLKRFSDYGTASAPMNTFIESASDVARKQLQGLEQINTSIDQINRSAQANAASAQEAASVAEETTAQAMSVREIVHELAGVVGYRG